VENKELVFGRNPVLEYLQSAKPGSNFELFVAQSAHGKIINSIVHAAEAKSIKVQFKDKAFFAGLGPSSRHQGVILKIPRSFHVTGTVAGPLLTYIREHRGVLVLLDRITDPHNVGSIIRTAEALGCGGVILSKSHAPGITPGVVKASAGATAHIEIHHASNIASFLAEARAAGLWIIGASEHGEKDLDTIGDIRPCVVVIGSEDTGMRQLTLEKCDFLVRIPLAGKVSSLNASVAAGIILYQIMRK
jgi:23S rRNA (guanosine2251-2'-O)-methyltransferase